MKKPYDLNAAPPGSIVSVKFSGRFHTYEKQDGWMLDGIPIVVMTSVLRIGEQAYYRVKGNPVKTGMIEEIVPRT
jgi:hypothetical protein